jgi:ATP-dependent helicase/nuclease subunit B
MAQVEVTTAAARETANDEWLAGLAERLRADRARQVLCIVPTGGAARRLEQRLLREHDLPGLYGAPIRTFYRLARDIARDTRLGTHDLSDLQRSLLLRDIAADADVPTLARVQQFPGFAAALGDLIGEIKLAMVGPEQLQEALAQLPGEEADLAAKLRDILTLYKRYHEILGAQKLHDAEGLMWHAVAEIEKRPDLLAPASVFFFHGFRSFNQVQLRLVEAIAASAREVRIKLPYDPTRPDVFAPSQRAIETLRHRLACELRAAARSGCDAGDIAHIAADLFRADAQQKPSEGSAIILESGSPAQEAEQVAREIQLLVAGAAEAPDSRRDNRPAHRRDVRPSLTYGDIAIIARGAEARQRMSHLLARCGVPVNERVASLAASAAGRCLVSCLQTILHDWPASLVGSTLKSPCLGGDAIATARAEIASWKQGINEGREVWFQEWGDDDTVEARRRVLEPMRLLEDKLKQAASPADMADAVRELVKAFAPPDGDDPAAQRDDAMARQKIEQVIGEIAASTQQTAKSEGSPRQPDSSGVATRRRLSWQRFCEDLERAIAAAGYKPGPRAADAVTILDAQRLGGETYPVVFVVNLLENVLPAQAREDPFLRDRERRLLAAENPQIRLDLAADRQAEERLLFWRAISCATDRLYLSYPTEDENANEVLPSFYVDEVRQLFEREGPGRLRTVTRRFSDLAPAPARAICAADWAASILHGFACDLSPAEQAEHIAHFNAWLAWSGAPPDPLRGCPGAPPARRARPELYVAPAPDYPRVLADEALLAALKDRDRPYTPTELEAYLACPYLYFCQRLLAISAVERELAPLDVGLVLHGVLARLYREWSRESGGPVDVTGRSAQEVVERALELLDQALAREPRFANQPSALRSMEREALRGTLELFVAADLMQTGARGLRPAYFELRFGGYASGRRGGPDASGLSHFAAARDLPAGADPSLAPLDLGEVHGRRALIGGRVDRVDLTGDGRAVIVDYKLGGQSDMRDLDGGAMLQAPLYAMAVRQALRLDLAGVEYATIRTRRRRGVYCAQRLLARRKTVFDLVLTPEEMEAKLDAAAERARHCIAMIQRGEMPRGPRDSRDAWRQCQRCAYQDICRVDAWTLRQIMRERERAAGTAAVEAQEPSQSSRARGRRDA